MFLINLECSCRVELVSGVEPIIRQAATCSGNHLAAEGARIKSIQSVITEDEFVLEFERTELTGFETFH